MRRGRHTGRHKGRVDDGDRMKAIPSLHRTQRAQRMRGRGRGRGQPAAAASERKCRAVGLLFVGCEGARKHTPAPYCPPAIACVTANTCTTSASACPHPSHHPTSFMFSCTNARSYAMSGPSAPVVVISPCTSPNCHPSHTVTARIRCPQDHVRQVVDRNVQVACKHCETRHDTPHPTPTHLSARCP